MTSVLNLNYSVKSDLGVSKYVAPYIQSGINVLRGMYNYVPSWGSIKSKVHLCPITKTDQLSNLLKPYIQQERIHQVIKAIRESFSSKQIHQIQEIQSVAGGRGTSKILKFRMGNKEYVIRLTDDSRPHFFIDPSSEIKRMKIADSLKVTPELIYANDKEGVLIMEFIENQRLTIDSLEDPGLHQALAQNLKKLHEGPTLSEDTNVFRDMEKTAKGGVPENLPGLAHEVMETVSPLEALLQPYFRSVPSHKELNSNNVLYDGNQFYFIDWETAANCDPFVDLAILSNFYVFNPKQEEIFLSEYFSGPPTDKQKAQLYLMKQVCLCFYAFKFLRRATLQGKVELSPEQIKTLPNYRDFILDVFNGSSKTYTVEDFKRFAYIYLNEAAKNIQSSQFKESIQILKE